MKRDLHPVESVVWVIVEGYYQTMRMVDDEHLQERPPMIRVVRLLIIIKMKQQGASQREAVDREVPMGDITWPRTIAFRQ